MDSDLMCSPHSVSPCWRWLEAANLFTNVMEESFHGFLGKCRLKYTLRSILAKQDRSKLNTTIERVSTVNSKITKIADVIYQTGETVFHRGIQTTRRELKIRRAAECFDKSRGVWIADGTLSRVCDISSQSGQKLRSKLMSFRNESSSL